jgi:hypothetical protein
MTTRERHQPVGGACLHDEILSWTERERHVSVAAGRV